MISIIILNYHVKEELFDCLSSIIASKPKTAYEIIIVDNDEVKSIKIDLFEKFPKVKYISNKNKGFGQGNNVGAKHAEGEYLFFLNPDTIIFKNSIDELVNFLKKNKNAGAVAPFLLHENKKPFEQGTKELTPFRAIFSLSLIHKLFPNNPVAKKYFIQWDKFTTKEVDVVPGTAFMISRKLYKSLNGFDENFFLYFEEFDLCKRIKEKGYKLFIEPKAKIIHLWERSTKKRNDINKIFKESRFYYFRKHFGLFPAFITETILRISKYSVLLMLILLAALLLRLNKIDTYLPFTGDQGWFFISARDMLLTGNIPLIGIASSHPWLHQGPLWTYILAGVLWISHFNPLSGAYFTIILGLLTIVLLFLIGSKMFSSRIGVLASLFYSTAPFMIVYDRQAYHTSLITVLTLLLFYAFYCWTKGNKYFFPLILFLLSLLYNFEIATIIFYAILFIILLYGIGKKTSYIAILKNKKVVILSFLGLLFPMIPMLMYDRSHGFPQTLKFGFWIIYKIAIALGFPAINGAANSLTFSHMIPFASYILQLYLFFQNSGIAWFLLGISLVNLVFIIVKTFQRDKLFNPYTLLFLFFVIPAVFYIAERTNSDAYWIVFMPIIPFLLALFFDQLLDIPKGIIITTAVIIFITVSNSFGIVQSHYLTGKNDTSFADRMNAVKFIIRNSHGRAYNLFGRGPNSQHESFTKNYEYLAWWMGHGPSKENEPLKYFISERGSIIIQKEEQNL